MDQETCMMFAEFRGRWAAIDLLTELALEATTMEAVFILKRTLSHIPDDAAQLRKPGEFSSVPECGIAVAA